MTLESSNHCLENGGLIGLDLRCMLFLALALAGLLMPLAGSVREGGHVSGIILMGALIIVVMAIRLWHG